MLCHECHHRPSERFEEGNVCRCYCKCHDVADAAPELLAVLREAREYARVLAEALSGPDQESTAGCLARIDAVIAKATH